MAPVAAKSERLPRPATDYERWLGDDEQQLDSVRQYDLDRGVNEYSNDGLITITGESNSPEIVGSNDPGTSTLSSEESSQPSRQYAHPTAPEFVAFYAVMIIAVLVVLGLHGSLRKSRWRRQEEKKGQLMPIARHADD
ncbi:hypothetical protein BDW72DRAFT_208252 [Aspergillus terricola var. indicus]